MAHRLIPDFIIENYAQGNMSGDSNSQFGEMVDKEGKQGNYYDV